jgi:spore coat protein U-like protein
MFNRKALRTACLMAACCATVLSASAANAAGSDTDDITVTTDVVAFCSVTGGPLNFADYANLQIDLSMNLAVLCTNTTAYDIELSAGQSTDAADRTMAGPGADEIHYQLYTTAGRNTVWDDTNTVGGNGTGVSVNVPVYGRIPAGQGLPIPGAYSDTITATLTY